MSQTTVYCPSLYSIMIFSLDKAYNNIFVFVRLDFCLWYSNFVFRVMFTGIARLS